VGLNVTWRPLPTAAVLIFYLYICYLALWPPYLVATDAVVLASYCEVVQGHASVPTTTMTSLMRFSIIASRLRQRLISERELVLVGFLSAH
jgi:hypothetical protein